MKKIFLNLLAISAMLALAAAAALAQTKTTLTKTAPSRTYAPPHIYVTEINLAPATSSSELNGTFKILNSDFVYYGGLIYEIKILKETSLDEMPFTRQRIAELQTEIGKLKSQPGVSAATPPPPPLLSAPNAPATSKQPPLKVIVGPQIIYKVLDEFIAGENFFVAPGKEISKSFKYVVSGNLPPGKYLLEMGVVLPSGSEVGQITKEFDWRGNAQGNGGFLDLQDGVVVAPDSKIYLPDEGINITKDDSVKLKILIKNPTSKALNVTPQISVAQATGNLKKVADLKEDPVQFNPQETKTLIYSNLPKNEVAGAYVGVFRFFDKNNQPVSGLIDFRWVVRGPSARILSIEQDKDVYVKNDKANLGFWLAGPAENNQFSNQNLTLKNVVLSAKISDGSGNLCGQASKTIPEISSTLRINLQIPVSVLCLNPKIQAELNYGGQGLASSQTLVTTSQEFRQKIKTKINYLYILIPILVLGLLYFILRKKNEPQI